MAREYQLKSPGKPGGLLPLGAPSVPAAPVPAPVYQPNPAAPGIPVRITGGAGAVPSRGAGADALLAPTGHVYPADTSRQVLSKNEKTALAMLAGQAFAELCRRDPDYLPEMLAQGWKKTFVESEWRHSQVKLATTGHPDGIAQGISKARRSHYRTIQAHFQAALGQDVASLNTAMRTGPAIGKAGRDGDRTEDVENARNAVYDAMQRLKLNLYYVQYICGGKDGTGGKFHTRNIESLTAKQLWQLLYTLKNRAAARDGKGDPDNRNKSQRKKKKP